MKVTFCLLALLLLLPVALAAPTTGREEARPNILFIMADDHSLAATSCYGSRITQTPNLDRLAASGVRFNHMAVTLSLCSPSRAALLSGRYAHKNGVMRNKQRFDGSQPTFPKALQRAGYETAIVGKWHLATQPTGFDYYNVFPHQGRYVDPRLKEAGQPWVDGKEGGTAHVGYATDLVTDLAIDWLNDRSPGRPFCLMVHHKAPHGPHIPAPRHADLLSTTILEEPKSLLDDYSGRIFERREDTLKSRLLLLEGATGLKKMYGEEARKAREMGRAAGTRSIYQHFMRGYLRMVASLDENVGRLLDHLDESGLSQDTIVIYTSDNGYFNGEHGFFGKCLILEESMMVPLMIRWPGEITPGSVNDELVSMLDIGPTLIELAGGEIPPGLQGRSLLPLLRKEDVRWRDALYYHFYGKKGSSDGARLPEQFGIRTRTHKLVHYPRADSEHRWELFDLQTDPTEMHNLYRNPESKESVATLKDRLRGLITQYGDTTATLGEG